ncbi:hypothetical protein FRX31_017537 [Thalictrum thalictroides]|uniref:Uncharacterized protein n=1 Tax=Thalictrum thalictroides TaxID=46969 RepID=A0A7J6W910_THATH|nr:hypothetical protein FRX31_017537 [Thalictrum thalictroides]
MVYGYPQVVNCKDPSFERVGDPKLMSYYLGQKQKLSAKFKNFVIRCLNDNPANRPTAGELLQDPFLQFEIENTTELLEEIMFARKLHSQIEDNTILGWSLRERLLKLIPESKCVEQGGNSNDNELDNSMVPVQNIQHSVEYVKSEIQFIKVLNMNKRVNIHLNNIEIAMSNFEDSAIQFHTLLEG